MQLAQVLFFQIYQYFPFLDKIFVLCNCICFLYNGLKMYVCMQLGKIILQQGTTL